MKKYTTYEQTEDKETASKDTRSMHEWYLYYLLWIDRTEYPDFITWLADMLKTGNLIEEPVTESQMDAIASYMDDNIRERVHFELVPCTPGEFLRRYIELDPSFEELLSSEFRIEL